MPHHTTRITDLLTFGNQESCRDDLAVVHACKEPCHRKAVGYAQKSLEKTHPHYLSLEKNNHLYLNLIDPPIPLFQLESFRIFLDFMERNKHRHIHIHCNQGESRAPSLALLYMAKKLNLLPAESFDAARAEFEKKFPYKPGKGIVKFLQDNWDKI